MIVTKKCITQNDLFENEIGCANSSDLSLLHTPSSFLFLAKSPETANIATEELADVLEIFVDTSMGAFSVQT